MRSAVMVNDHTALSSGLDAICRIKAIGSGCRGYSVYTYEDMQIEKNDGSTI